MADLDALEEALDKMNRADTLFEEAVRAVARAHRRAIVADPLPKDGPLADGFNAHRAERAEARIADLERERDEARAIGAALVLNKTTVEREAARAEKAEAEASRLRKAVEAVRDAVASFQRRQPMIELHDNFIISIRDRLTAALQPEVTGARGDPDPVSAPDLVKVREALEVARCYAIGRASTQQMAKIDAALLSLGEAP